MLGNIFICSLKNFIKVLDHTHYFDKTENRRQTRNVSIPWTDGHKYKRSLVGYFLLYSYLSPTRDLKPIVLSTQHISSRSPRLTDGQDKSKCSPLNPYTAE